MWTVPVFYDVVIYSSCSFPFDILEECQVMDDKEIPYVRLEIRAQISLISWLKPPFILQLLE